MDYGLVQVATPDEVATMEAEQAQNQEQQETAAKDAFASDLQTRWHGYQQARKDVEKEWLDGLRAVKGEYDSDQEQLMNEQGALSRVFIKITATKVNAAYSRLVDLLFQNVDSFWDIVPSPMAEVPAAIRRHIRMTAINELLPYPLPAQVRNHLIQERADEMERGLMAEAMEQADEAAMRMRRQIKDYLVASDALTDIKQMVREQVTLGTGCMKVATLNIRNHEKWESEGDQWTLNKKQTIEPDVQWASVFDMFPDPYSFDCGKPNDLFRRHVLTKHELRELGETPGFDMDMIGTVLTESPEGNHTALDYERDLRRINETDEQFVQNRRFDVLEYWGPVDGSQLERYGIKEVDESMEYQANIWVCNGRVIMARMNPLKPESIPYKFVPYEKVLHRFWGVGIPKMMDDSQDVMNAAARALLDNAALTAGPMFQIDVSKLPEGVSLEEAKKIYPYRLWFYDGQRGEGPMVQAIHVQSNQSQLSAIFEMFRKFADEETSLPSYTHGEQGQGLNKTASGMSMLMTAANVALKSVVKNIDDYATQPLIQSLYHFAMRWSDNDSAKRGDLDVVPMGSTALVAKEIQSQRMMQAMQVTSNEVFGPMTNQRFLLNEYFKSLDIDPDKAMRPEESMQSNPLDPVTPMNPQGQLPPDEQTAPDQRRSRGAADPQGQPGVRTFPPTYAPPMPAAPGQGYFPAG